MQGELLLSILIPTIPSRNYLVNELLEELERQSANLPVELLSLYDNKKRTVGEKRNSLLREARGRFIVFLDDDDTVVDDYVPTVVKTIQENPDVDCIVYDQICQRPGIPDLYCRYGLELEYNHATTADWTGKPAHTMPWRRELAQRVAFSDVTYNEDKDWVARACKLAKTQARIDKVMYYYRFNPKISQTRHQSAKVAGRNIKPPTVSVVIATRNKEKELGLTLKSILCQETKFEYEVIVVDDGSEYDVWRICCQDKRVKYIPLKNDKYRNPGIARNVGYRAAQGKVLILQSDDVIHESLTLERLSEVQPGTFNIGTVYNTIFSDTGKQIRECYTGKTNQRPLFFLGSVLREYIYKIGGNCEEFTEPGYEDDWLGRCLINGLGLQPIYCPDVIGYHQDHPRPPLKEHYSRMEQVYSRKYQAAKAGTAPWIGGEPWPL